VGGGKEEKEREERGSPCSGGLRRGEGGERIFRSTGGVEK